MATINPDLAFGQELSLVQGSTADFPLNAVDVNQAAMVFSTGDLVTAKVYRGQGQALLFAPTAVWTPTNGYLTGAVTVSPTAAQTLTLEANGEYQLHVIWTQADLARSATVIRRRIKVFPSPGLSTQATTPYCTYADLLNVGAWLAGVQDMDTDQEGFYTQRLEARTWLDWAIIQSYQGSNAIGMYNISGSAMNWGGGEAGPNSTVIADLAANKLIVRPNIVKACAHYAAGLVGLSQIATNPQLTQKGMWHQAKAERLASSIVAEVDTDADGKGNYYVNLSSVATIFG